MQTTFTGSPSQQPQPNHRYLRILSPTLFVFSLPLSSAAPHQVGLAPGFCKESTHYSSEKRTTNQSYGPTYFFLHVDESTRHVLALCKALSHSHCAQSPCRDPRKKAKIHMCRLCSGGTGPWPPECAHDALAPCTHSGSLRIRLKNKWPKLDTRTSDMCGRSKRGT